MVAVAESCAAQHPVRKRPARRFVAALVKRQFRRRHPVGVVAVDEHSRIESHQLRDMPMVVFPDLAILLFLAIFLDLPGLPDLHGIVSANLPPNPRDDGVVRAEDGGKTQKVVVVLPYHLLVERTSESLVERSVLAFLDLRSVVILFRRGRELR